MNKNLLVLVVIIILATIMYFISGITPTNKIACTEEAFICPDGSSVGRSGPKCEFAPCPTITPEKEIQGEMCGGFAGILCPKEYDCQLDGNYPDAGGICVKITPNLKN